MPQRLHGVVLDTSSESWSSEPETAAESLSQSNENENDYFLNADHDPFLDWATCGWRGGRCRLPLVVEADHHYDL